MNKSLRFFTVAGGGGGAPGRGFKNERKKKKKKNPGGFLQSGRPWGPPRRFFIPVRIRYKNNVLLTRALQQHICEQSKAKRDFPWTSMS